MRHRKVVKKLNRTREHRKATLANLAIALLERKKIRTTHAKAKAAQRFVERLITLAKRNDLHSRRLVLQRLRNKKAMFTLFNDIAPTFAGRNGGYTRVIHLGQREGDAAQISMLELVGFEGVVRKKAKKEKETEQKKTAASEETTADEGKK
ncbi:50S ribosomal protein L17 [candidate division KSB1 bacterium]|nr:50S ribosomal protein L17 [bacterium]RKY80115.1 MAG: 50S ribosomal protein L17 [candidate division KSB1 bacterium]HDI51770.1 50S ribosomal protein L17 [Bacteroidota bacterium]RKY81109.1 MAG: 50S ribosomal protein L17 [candidate division KSB1 bacterium]RKY89550.1 MAG: 50S ribosomal protein L17 [candidate division KSB1 bacterium]